MLLVAELQHTVIQCPGIGNQPGVLRDNLTIISFELRDCPGSDGVLWLAIFFRKGCQVFNLLSCKNYCHAHSSGVKKPRYCEAIGLLFDSLTES